MAAGLASKEDAEYRKAPFCRRQAYVRASIKEKTERNTMSGTCGEFSRDETRLGRVSLAV